MNYQEVEASVSPEVQMNENFESIEHAFVYGKRHPVTTGLTWGYWGGRWSGFLIAEGTIALTNNAVNYLVVNRATGAISNEAPTVSPFLPTNWFDVKNYARVYAITASSGVVTSVEDHRAGKYGVFGGTSLQVDDVGWARVYARDDISSSALVWGYLGGRWRAFNITAGTLTLADASTNYLVVERATGTLSTSTAVTNWNDTTNYARVFQVTTSGGVVTAIADYRAASNGIFDPAGDAAGGGGGGGTASFVITAYEMYSNDGNLGGAAVTIADYNLGNYLIRAAELVAGGSGYVGFSKLMPDDWDGGDITYEAFFVLSGSSGSADVSITVGAAGLDPGEDGAGLTAVPSDLVTTTTTAASNGYWYKSAESAAITPEGTTAAGGLLVFQLIRDVDSQTGSAQLTHIKINYGTA